MEETPEFTVMPQHIFIISEIEGLKREIKSLKGTIINQLQDEMDKRGFSSTDNNTKTIIDAMVPETKETMEEIVRKTEVLMSKVTEEYRTNGSNIMDIAIEEEVDEEDNDFLMMRN